MRKRIHCVFHQEASPSLVWMGDAWRCFGACHKAYTKEEVEARSGIDFGVLPGLDDDKEDLSLTFEYIDSLPVLELRGLKFPCDQRGYYIVWPNNEYYKYRLFEGSSRYLSPRGYSPPLFWARHHGGGTLAITEGELNSMSVAMVCEEWDVCSPGSASNFNADYLARHLQYFKNYSSIVVILDKDAAGLKGLIETKAYFANKLPFVSYVRMERDANEVLQQQGRGALREMLVAAAP